MTVKTKKDKPIPKSCVCGKPAVTVRTRGGKMVSCPDPMNCRGNLRTRWHRHEANAVTEWDNLVDAYRYAAR